MDAFDKFFAATTGHGKPFAYQARLAGGKDGTKCESKLINIPTGCGKTAAVVLAWLWNRVEKKRADWPHSPRLLHVDGHTRIFATLNQPNPL